jgi:hypothetical protein
VGSRCQGQPPPSTWHLMPQAWLLHPAPARLQWLAVRWRSQQGRAKQAWRPHQLSVRSRQAGLCRRSARRPHLSAPPGNNFWGTPALAAEGSARCRHCLGRHNAQERPAEVATEGGSQRSGRACTSPGNALRSRPWTVYVCTAAPGRHEQLVNRRSTALQHCMHRGTWLAARTPPHSHPHGSPGPTRLVAHSAVPVLAGAAACLQDGGGPGWAGTRWQLAHLHLRRQPCRCLPQQHRPRRQLWKWFPQRLAQNLQQQRRQARRRLPELLRQRLQQPLRVRFG